MTSILRIRRMERTLVFYISFPFEECLLMPLLRLSQMFLSFCYTKIMHKPGFFKHQRPRRRFLVQRCKLVSTKSCDSVILGICVSFSNFLCKCCVGWKKDRIFLIAPLHVYRGFNEKYDQRGIAANLDWLLVIQNLRTCLLDWLVPAMVQPHYFFQSPFFDSVRNEPVKWYETKQDNIFQKKNQSF